MSVKLKAKIETKIVKFENPNFGPTHSHFFAFALQVFACTDTTQPQHSLSTASTQPQHSLNTALMPLIPCLTL